LDDVASRIVDSPGAYIAIGILAVVVLTLALRSNGMNPVLAALAQILVVLAAVALIDPLGAKPIIALGITYYAGFFMGRAFEQEQAKKTSAPVRKPGNKDK
jgi:hypothetical protein